jgi:nucleobase:cation symporter-1, NCS1 family
VYDVAFFVGIALGIILYLIFCRIWPPEGLGIMEELDEGRIIEGKTDAPSLSGEDVDKSTMVLEKQVPV